MTKEIKYRVWDGNKMSKPFGFGDLFGYEGERNAVTLHHPYTSEGQDFTICSHDGGNPSYPSDDSDNGVNPNLVFLQFTGLKTKNGTEIFEGDIIKQPDSRPQVIEREMSWNCGCCDSVYGWSFDFDEELTEVIGNIYEHSHLMK